MNDVGSIVEKVKTGDESALRSLYDIFSPMMKNVCAGIIRGGGGAIGRRLGARRFYTCLLLYRQA